MSLECLQSISREKDITYGPCSLEEQNTKEANIFWKISICVLHFPTRYVPRKNGDWAINIGGMVSNTSIDDLISLIWSSISADEGVSKDCFPGTETQKRLEFTDELAVLMHSLMHIKTVQWSLQNVISLWLCWGYMQVWPLPICFNLSHIIC